MYSDFIKKLLRMTQHTKIRFC